MKTFFLSIRSLSRILFILAIASSQHAAFSGESCNSPEPKKCIELHLKNGDFELAYALLETEAPRGDAESQLTLGLLIVNGKGSIFVENAPQSERDLLAFPWIKLAAIGGSRRANEWLADAYEKGWFHLVKNQAMAHCLRKAAKFNASAGIC